MKKLSLLFLMLAIVVAGNAREKKCRKCQMKPRKIVSVSIWRTVCFGSCPEYKVKLTKKGMATYTAKRFTKDTGIFEKNVGRDKAMQVIDKFVKYRVDTCQENYENMIPDIAGLIITIEYKRCKKVIYNAHFGPKYLEILATDVEAVGKKQDASWVKTGMPELN